jgi:two-component system, OmpR family, alkaline phosphatase synthesis response regulator PhoP
MAAIDVMIADDEPHIVRALAFVLEREGFVVATAADGEEVLRLIGATKPRLLFLDLIMPKKTGDQVCRAIKQDPALAEIRIIVLTCKGQELDRDQSLANGADYFITKPFSPREVVAMVKDILGNQRQ